jgi:hypothetical protein
LALFITCRLSAGLADHPARVMINVFKKNKTIEKQTFHKVQQQEQNQSVPNINHRY